MPNVHKWENRKKPLDTTTPKSKGGGRSKHPNIDEAGVQAIKAKNPHRPEASLRNLKQWQPGTSGNPSGKSTSINEVMRLARSRCCEAIEKLTEIMRDPDADHKSVIAACMAIMDRGLGRPIVPVFRGTPNGYPAEMISEIGADGAETALISAAKAAPDAYRRTLESELERLNREEAEAKAAARDEVDEAAAAMARGEEISPLMKMLVTVRNETN